jgi:hypothetical protein
MRRYSIVRIGRALAVTLLVLMSAALTAAATQAAPSFRPNTGGTLTLALANGTTFIYAGQPGGTPAPKFTATLVLTAKRTSNTAAQVIVTIGSQTFANSSAPSVSADQLTYTFTVDTAGVPLPAGQYTAQARYHDPVNGIDTTSNTVSFTINRATPQPQCTINNVTLLVDTGQTLRITMSFNSDNAFVPVDWQNATYQIIFVGNTAGNTITSSVLSPDNQDSVTVQAPARYDWYAVDCRFLGTNNFGPATGRDAGQPILISAKHPLGTVHFTSNPWPLVPNQTAHVDIKFDAAPGGPIPNGAVAIQIGRLSTNFIELGANGEIATTLGSLASYAGITDVFVLYQGDPYYNAGSVGFPMPSGSGGGGGGGGSQPTATSAQTPGAAGTATAQAYTGGTPGISTSTGDSNTLLSSNASRAHNAGGNSLPWWLALASVVVLLGGGGVGGGLYLSRRAARTRAFVPDPHTDSHG